MQGKLDFPNQYFRDECFFHEDDYEIQYILYNSSI